MVSTDVYSITNPALGSLILWSFLQGYEEKGKSSCELPLLFIPLPLVLPKLTRDEFIGTNSETGLYTWISRKQKVLINLELRVNKTSNLTRNAIIFGCSNGLLTLQETGTIVSCSKGLVKSRINDTSDEIKDMLKVSKRLGIWFSQINSTSNILNCLGLTL